KYTTTGPFFRASAREKVNSLPAWLAWAVNVGAMAPGPSAAKAGVAEASAISAPSVIDPARRLFIFVTLIEVTLPSVAPDAFDGIIPEAGATRWRRSVGGALCVADEHPAASSVVRSDASRAARTHTPDRRAACRRFRAAE